MRAAFLMATVALAACTPPAEPVVAPVPVPTVAPTVAPADPPPVVDGDVTIAHENGLRIVIKRIEGAELASLQLYVRGGARLRQPETAGIELLGLRTSIEGGTETLEKEAFGRKLSSLGSDLGTSSLNAYSVIAAKALTENVGATFALMADAFLAPALPPSEIELQRDRLIASIKQRDVTPDGRLELLVNEAMYKGHPFENLSTGTETSVASLTPAMIAEHLASLRQTRRLSLVVVGDVTLEQIGGLVREHFGELPRGAYEHAAVPSPRFERPKLSIVPSELPTTYIEASFPAPRWEEADFAASIIAMRILSRRVWEEVRTKRNLSYAPSARHGWSGESPRGSLYVTAVDPNTTMRVMIDEVQKLASAPVDEVELAGARSVFVTSHLMSNESTDGQGSWLAMCDLIGGDWRLSRSLPERIKAVTASEIQTYVEKHVRRLQTVVLGPTAPIDEALFESL
jgi:zinc protease